MRQAKLLVRSQNILGEGAWFDFKTQTLIWLDIFGQKINKLNVKSGEHKIWAVPKPVTTIVPAEKGGYVLGMIDGIYHIDDAFHTLNPIPGLNVDFTSHRCNDGKCDPQGRFWIGIMELEGKKGDGALHIADGKSCMLGWDALDVPNGIVWNSKGDTVYFTDTIEGEIYRFDYRDGNLSNKQTIYKATEGMTDGMAIDEEDMIWVAVWGSGKVFRIDPSTGKTVDYVEVGVPNVTSAAIADGKIYITTASIGLTEEELAKYPESGGLFVAEVGLKGVQSPMFKG